MYRQDGRESLKSKDEFLEALPVKDILKIKGKAGAVKDSGFFDIKNVTLFIEK